jgi:hypothetical protein
MPMTRHPVRSSFTFEIKRANRRAPEVLTRSKTSSPEVSSLADQVFGKLSTHSRARQPSQIEVPAPVRTAPIFGTNSPDTGGRTESSAERSARRVLPDLLSAAVNLVDKREQHDAEERTARRKAARMGRAKKDAERSLVAAARDDAAPALVVTTQNTVSEQVDAGSRLLKAVATLPPGSVQSVEQVATSLKRKKNALVTAFRKAEHNGQPVPRLPAGQRWNRYLLKACW